LSNFSDSTTRLPGIDVSNHQGTIDWNLVAYSGVQFAFIKASEGGTYQDPFYGTNISGARKVGISAAPYHFFRPKGSVSLQLKNFLHVVESSDIGNLPPVLDLEVPNDWGHFKIHERVEMVIEFLQGLEDSLNRRPIIYMSASFSEDVLGEAKVLKDYPLWVAHHTPAAEPWIPKPWTAWSYWQHSDKGTVNGINGPVDMDWFHGNHLLSSG
jgi:lysozyme